MHPPADPWGDQDEADTPPFMYGRAPVPDLSEPTTAMPAAERRRPVPPPPKVSWQKTSRASLRTMADGWGFTAFGLLVLVCGWGVWAASGARAVVHPLVDLILVLAVGGLIFATLRGSGRVLLEGVLGRTRPHARWSHFLTCVYLCVVGASYFARNSWLITGTDWIKELFSHL